MSGYPFLLAGKDPSHVEGMDAEFRKRLEALIQAAPGGGLQVYSGYRSPERQSQLYKAAIQKYGSPEAARKWVAPPGRSRHNHGTAADLKFASPDVQKWVHANAPNYGLHFRMGHEPWHIEPMPGWKGQATGMAALPQSNEISNAEYLGQFKNDVPAMAKMMAPGAVAPFFQPVPPKAPPPSAPMGTAMTGFPPQHAPQAPTMTAGVNPMQGAPGTPPPAPSGLAGLFGPKPQGGNPMGGMAQALMGGMAGMAGMGGGQQMPQQSSFVVPAAEPGSINPTPQGGQTDPRIAALLRLLQQNA